LVHQIPVYKTRIGMGEGNASLRKKISVMPK